jgi:choline kinase
MNIEELSGELRGVMEFERSIFEKIEEMEKKGTESDLINYAKMIIKNTTGREISEIQEIYLEKIDRDYLSS